MRKTWIFVMAGLVILALLLAACGGDDKSDSASEDQAAEPTGSDGVTLDAGPDLPTGPDLGGSSLAGGEGERDLPGCSDPDDDACPAPLVMSLDGTAEAEGVRLTYPARYFDAATGADADGALIQIAPSERYKFDEQATFAVFFAESTEAALEGLPDVGAEPETAEWSTPNLPEGKICVVRDETQDPPVVTVRGAFDVANEGAVVLELVVTGKYGWDLFTDIYVGMLNSLVVE